MAYEYDDNIAQEGDIAFLGLASRYSPLSIKAGLVQRSENMRMDRGTLRTRLGSHRLADDVSITGPLALPFSLATDVAVSSATHSGTTATVNTVAAHGYVTTDLINIRGAVQADYNGDFFITKVDADTFTYTMGADPGADATGTLVANEGPVVRDTYEGGILGGGVFSDPETGVEYVVLVGADSTYLLVDGAVQKTLSYPGTPTETVQAADRVKVLQAFDKLYLLRDGGFPSKAVSGITTTGTVATATCNSHGYAAGERVRITGADQAAYNADHVVATVATNTFTFAVPSGTVSPATGSPLYARKVKPPLVWAGSGTAFARTTGGVHATGVTYSHFPSTAIAGYFNNQIVVGLNRDEVVLSDVLDGDTFDYVDKSFRCNSGSSDYIVALHPYNSSTILVFMRRSIYLITVVLDAETGLSIDPALSSVALLTNEIGCIARDSVVTAGEDVLFLSDAGVYRLQATAELKLLGNTKPLSDPIADKLECIDPALAPTATAMYWNNRYFLSAPTCDTGSTVYVFNTMLDAWESVDTYPHDTLALLVSEYESRQRLHAVSRLGKLFLLEEQEDGDDEVDLVGHNPVAGRITTRRYGFASLADKRLLRARISADLSQGDSIAIGLVTYDPDRTLSLGTLANSDPAREDYSVRLPLRMRAHSMELDITTTGGRPEIRIVGAEASGRVDPSETRTKY